MVYFKNPPSFLLLFLPTFLFYVHFGLIKDKKATDLILEAMQSIQNQTCLRFINRTTEKDFIHIYPDMNG